MQVRIKGYAFSLAEPYAEGHRLTASEAKAVNDLRAENIQNNFRSKVNAAVANLAPGELLPQAVIDGLKAELADYDQKYTFAEKVGRSRLGDLEQAALAVAAERVQAQLIATGSQHSIISEEAQKLIAETALLPAVVEEARARVTARRSALSGGMESL